MTEEIFQGFIELSREEYKTLSTTGSLTKDGVTITFDPLHYKHLVPDNKYIHVLKFTYNSAYDNEGFTGIVRMVNNTATPYTTSTLTANEIKMFCVSIGGAKYALGVRTMTVDSLDADGVTANGFDCVAGDITQTRASRSIAWTDTTCNTFTDTVIQIS